MKIISTVWFLICLVCISCESPDDRQEPDNDNNEECCKVCNEGKACGDTCIFQGDTCYEEPGCACNGKKETPKPQCGDGNCDPGEYEVTLLDGMRLCEIKCGADCDMEDFCED